VLRTDTIDVHTRERLVGARRHVVELVSTHFVVGFAGNALSVIGVGVISSFVSPLAASIVFAVTIAVFAVVALIVARQSLSKQTAN
jgi:hypothetical protein